MREIKPCLRCGQLEAEIIKKDKIIKKACEFIEEVHGTCPSDTGYPEPVCECLAGDKASELCETEGYTLSDCWLKYFENEVDKDA